MRNRISRMSKEGRMSKEENSAFSASSKHRRPRCAGKYAIELKGEDFIAFHEVVKGEDHLSFFCVADGHGGAHTSKWLSLNILPIIAHEAVDGSPDALQEACRRGFAKAHEEVKQIVLESDGSEHKSQNNTSGSTLTVVVLNHARREVRQGEPHIAARMTRG